MYKVDLVAEPGIQRQTSRVLQTDDVFSFAFGAGQMGVGKYIERIIYIQHIYIYLLFM
jgi:hypothetical protein